MYIPGVNYFRGQEGINGPTNTSIHLKSETFLGIEIFKKISDFFSCFLPSKYQAIKLSLPSNQKTIYVKADDVAKQVGLAKETIKDKKEVKLVDVYCHYLEQGPLVYSEFKKVIKMEDGRINRPLALALYTLSKHLKSPDRSDVAAQLLLNKEFNQKLINTILMIAEELEALFKEQQKELKDVATTVYKVGNKATTLDTDNCYEVFHTKKVKEADPYAGRYGYVILNKPNQEKEVFIRTRELIGKGGFKKVKGLVKLNDLEEYVSKDLKGASIQNKKELDSEIKVLNELHKEQIQPYFPKPHEAYYRITKEERHHKYKLIESKTNGTSQLLKEAPTKQLLEAIRHLALGLAFMHDKNLVHLDLKLANILFSIKNGNLIPQITDFGLTTRAGDWNRGKTLVYAAPEIQKPPIGPFKNTTQMDCFSFGLIILETLTSLNLAEGNSLGLFKLMDDYVMDKTGDPNEIQEKYQKRMETYLDGLKAEVAKKQFSDKENDDRLQLFELARGLLQFDPRARLSAKAVAQSIDLLLTSDQI